MGTEQSSEVGEFDKCASVSTVSFVGSFEGGGVWSGAGCRCVSMLSGEGISLFAGSWRGLSVTKKSFLELLQFSEMDYF